jgi:beta-glucosidase
MDVVPTFIFATGIENSSPTINGGRERVDEMEKCGHYGQWTLDFDCVQELGICFLRYGVPLHRVLLGESKYDWSFSDITFGELRRRDILPIADLCHFGVPNWIGNFQNPDFPQLFVRYADAFARRFPWIQLYTPINEMFVCAVFPPRLAGGTNSSKATELLSRLLSTFIFKIEPGRTRDSVIIRRFRLTM